MLTLENLSGNLYEGLRGRRLLDVQPVLPVVELQTRITNVPVEKILQSRGQ